MCLNKKLWLEWFSGGDDSSDEDFTHLALGSNRMVFAFYFHKGWVNCLEHYLFWTLAYFLKT